ncbi:hypothetical protein T458_06435 [Brevibacillus panacihumi W25]|uniref:Flagellar protein FliT n=1 Tax=Brevibacillus panacihumi W25 TaxID=1408254 RepID=V6MBR5_9BACL|nr:flagellar protein FliT [Brevibacillus panacihumi]EST55667.1 hypothetical protein T458_06435 [Brevibacillus panacihumi W25]
MNTPNSLRPLLENLLAITKELRKQILSDEENVEEWVELIEKREQSIQLITLLQNQNIYLSTEDKKKYLQKIYEIDLELAPLIEKKFEEVSKQGQNLQKSILVGTVYGGYGTISPYGAFFDKKN